MRYKRLGNTDMDVSVLSIGTWAMGGLNYGSVDEKDCIDAIHAMIDNGVNHIDTAWIYGLGHADEVVGKAIKGLRDKVYITSKAGFHQPEPGVIEPNHPDCSPEWITESLNKSLSLLGVDYVDEFLIHFPDRNVPFETIADCVKGFVKQGKARYVGVSNFAQKDMEDMSKYLDITANQSGYSMLARGEEPNLKWCKEHNIGVMTHSSLSNGLLTGAIRELPNYDKDHVTNLYGNIFFRPENFPYVQELLKTLDKIAEQRNTTVAQVAINWNVQKEFVTTSLVGVRNVKEAIENCKAAEWELTPAEIKEIDDAIANTVGKVKYDLPDFK